MVETYEKQLKNLEAVVILSISLAIPKMGLGEDESLDG